MQTKRSKVRSRTQRTSELGRRGIVAMRRSICWLLCFVFAPGLSAAVPRDYSQHDIVVATGRWEGHPARGGYGAARYRIDGVIRGSLTNHTVVILYHASTVDRSLPKKAILLLTPQALGDFSVLALDAAVGVLPDTAANRERITRQSDAELIDSPEERWLPKDEAESLLRKEASRRGIDISRSTCIIRRTHYGWRMYVSWRDARNDAWSGAFEISDSRKVRSSRTFRPAFGLTRPQTHAT